MAVYEGTTDDMLRRFGERARDYTLASGTDGDRISQTRAMAMINKASFTVHRKVRRSGNVYCLTREATLTQDSSDTTVYYLPSRAIGIFHVRDSDTTYYEEVNDPWDKDEPGYLIQKRLESTGKQLKLQELSPTGSVYARVLEEPVRQISGANSTTTSTTLTVGTTIGTARNNADYFANSEICITSGNDAGDIQTISSSTIGLVLTVSGWTTATPAAGTDTYSIMNSLPRELWDAVCAEAAYDNLATDKEIIEFAEEMRRERDETFMLGLLDLIRASASHVKEPRQTITWIR
jgi:hypothetical protein